MFRVPIIRKGRLQFFYAASWNFQARADSFRNDSDTGFAVASGYENLAAWLRPSMSLVDQRIASACAPAGGKRMACSSISASEDYFEFRIVKRL
jgi:hypothetical protein